MFQQIRSEVQDIRKTCWDVEAQSQTYRDDPANWQDIYVSRKISVWITYMLRNTAITPNQVTAVWVVMGVVGALLLAFSNFWVSWLGIFLLWMAMLLDHVDGELARVKKIFSSQGDFLDMIGHQLHYPMVFGSLTFGLVLDKAEPIFIFFGVLATVLATPISKMQENVLLLGALRHLGKILPPASSKKEDGPKKIGLSSLLGIAFTHVVMLYALIPAVFFGLEGLYVLFYGAAMAPAMIVKYFARNRELDEIFMDASLLREHLRPEWLDHEPPQDSQKVKE